MLIPRVELLKKYMTDPLAVAHARKVLEDHYFNYPGKYTVQQIINARGLTYREAPLSGSIGNIVFDGTSGTVTVSSNLKESTQKRFTAAHELGHFENEKTSPPAPLLKKARGVFVCGFEDVNGINRTSPREMSANDFAAELLMHEPWFVEKVKGKKLNVELLKETAAFFDVSLSATALRYTEIGHYPCAVVMTTNGVIKWKSASVNFPYQFLRVKEKVSELSYTSDYYKGDKFPKEGEDIPARAWFPEDYNLKVQEARIMELIIPYPSYNSALVVLWEE